MRGGSTLRTAFLYVPAAFVIAALAALAVIPQGSVASPPATGSGSYAVTGAVATGVRLADGNVFVTETESADATGTLTGTFAHDLVVTIHPDGSLNFRGKGTFTGTVDGVSGSFEDTIEGQGSVVSLELHGTITILRGSGDLVGLRGHLTIEGIPATGGTYAVQFHMDG